MRRSFTTQWNVIGLDKLSFGYSAALGGAFVELELDWPDGLLERPLRILEVGCGSG